MASNTDRQATFRRQMAEKGFVQVTGWVHADQAHDLRTTIDRLRRDHELACGPLRHEASGRLQKLNK